jgi:hypothetical protein
LIDLEFFKKEKWIGEGKILIENEEEDFPIIMKISLKDVREMSPIIEFTSIVCVNGSENVMQTHYTLTFHRKNTFHVLIAGENWGHVEGEGFIKNNFIGWEVKSSDGLFHGYESMEVDAYKQIIFFGEYAMKNEMRTKIEGKLTSYENSRTN